MAFKKTFVVSTENVNSYGFRVKTTGIDLSHAKNNCPAFYNHDTRALPLGQWTKLRIDDKGQLLGDLVIEGTNEEEKEYIRKIENGDIKGASIGADPIEWNSSSLQMAQGQTLPTLEKCDLFEISLTPLPANKSALRLTKDGKPIDISEVIALAAYINNSVTLKINLKMTPETLKLLNLDENATAIDVQNAVEKLLSEKKEVDIKSDEVIEERNSTIVESAVTMGKITYAQAEQYLVLLRKDFTETKKLVDSLEAPKTLRKDISITSLIEKGKRNLVIKNAPSISINKPKSEWNLDDYRKLAPQELKLNPELYQKLIQKEAK